MNDNWGLRRQRDPGAGLRMKTSHSHSALWPIVFVGTATALVIAVIRVDLDLILGWVGSVNNTMTHAVMPHGPWHARDDARW